MKVTDRTRNILAYRKGVRDLVAKGYEEISENGKPLFKFHRGDWIHRHIEDVVIGPDRKTLFIKVST